MNIISVFNQTMIYIESVLDGKIDEKMILQLSGYSYPMFSRIFSILTNITLTEYIRFRKLTESAINLRESNCKVIDIAIKYGYDSPDSFSAAFKLFHGFTPSEVRKGKSYKIFLPIQLTLGIKGGRSMDISIQKKNSFVVAGLIMNSIDTSMCPDIWKKLFEKCSMDELESMGSGQSFGVCFDIKDCNLINYMAAYDISNKEIAEKMNLDIMEIPENEYAVVTLKGQIPDSIHEGWKYLMEVFFPEHGYIHSGDPDFEVYGSGDMYSSDYEMELWVPVKRIKY